MRARVVKAVVENWHLKLVAVVLALVLFVVVRRDRDAATAAYAKIIYVLPEDRVLVSDPVTEVRLGLRGAWTRVSRLDERDIDTMRVDLSHATDGDFEFTEGLVKLPVGVHLVSITPSSVKLRFEPRVARTVPVQPILEGEPASGYRVQRSESHPKDVRVVGARSVVDAVQRARTRPLRITDAKEPVHGEVSLDAPPQHARWEGTGVVSVDVEIVAALGERKLVAVPVHVTGDARLEATLEPATVDVVLRGPVDVIAAVPAGTPSLLVDAASEDARPPSAYRKRVSVVGLPQGVAAEIRPEAVTLITRKRKAE